MFSTVPGEYEGQRLIEHGTAACKYASKLLKTGCASYTQGLASLICAGEATHTFAGDPKLSRSDDADDNGRVRSERSERSPPQSLLSSLCNIKTKKVTNQSIRLFSHPLLASILFLKASVRVGISFSATDRFNHASARSISPSM